MTAGHAQTFDRKQAVIIAITGQVNTLDPLRGDYGQTNVIDSALYDTLVLYDADKRLVGRLATSFTASPDVKSVAITLRPDVKFHDGRTVSAKDVAYTLDRLKKLGSGIAAQIEGYESTTVTDATHLTINLSKPYSLFLGALSKIYIVNSDLVAANAGTDDGQAWLQAHDAGSGPYQLLPVEGAEYRAKRFDGYFEPVNDRPAALFFRRIDEGATKRAELAAGNIDLAYGLIGRDMDALGSDPGIGLVYLQINSMAEMIFNTRTGPTADPRVRKAIRLAYDYKGGFAAIRGNRGSLANGPLPGPMSCRPDLPIVKQDFPAARQILADAGVKNLTVTMKFQPAFEEQKQEATLMQSNLRQIGVTLNLEPIAFPNYLASLSNPESIPQMMLLSDFAQFPDPGVVIVKGYASTAIGTNRPGYSNPKVDALILEALASADPVKQCDVYRQIQTILDQDSVMVDMYTLTSGLAYRKSAVMTPDASGTVSPFEPGRLRVPK